MRFACLSLAFCAASVLPVLPAVAQSVPSTDVAKDSLQGQRYVAIGSSFAAGPMLPPAKPGGPARCGQSMNNYPTLLAERLGMVLVDRSCSGATTDHVLGPWGDIPPQIAAVTPETRLVTITIGGNDLSYIGNLFSATCSFNAKAAEIAGATPKTCADVRVPTEEDYLRDEKQMNEIARRIRQTAPKARIVLVQYLNPLPAPGSLCPATPISEGDAETVREIGRRLAEITDRVALANNAIVVEMNQSSAAHTPCDPEPWMIGSPKGYDGKQGLQWHLNKAGMQATADGIAYWLNEAGTKPAAPMPTREAAGSAKAVNKAPSTPVKPKT
jgi:hypothetical protein